MLTLTLRDLQYRWRQFAIAIVGAALTFALALLLTGVSAGFDAEAEDTVDAVGADTWVVQEGVTGPFTSVSGLPADTAGELAKQPGVEDAQPFVASPNTARLAEQLEPINVVGVTPGELGAPEVDSGDALAQDGQTVVSDRLGADIGETVAVADGEFEVVGVVDERTYLAGQPVVYLTLPDAQQLAFGGEPLSNAVVVKGSVDQLPARLVELSNEEVEEDMLRGLEGAISAIDLMRLLMWIVAAVIIGAVIYLSTLERLNDFAVLKAVGGESRSLAFGLSLQALIAAVLAGALGIGLAALLAPAFPLRVEVGPGSYALLIAVAAVVGIVSSLVALRRVLKVDPALAFS